MKDSSKEAKGKAEGNRYGMMVVFMKGISEKTRLKGKGD